jgi:hypothetical protein
MTPYMFCYWDCADCFIAFVTLETKTMGCLPPIIEKKNIKPDGYEIICAMVKTW